MSKWLSKFTKKSQSPTDKADIVTSVSGMSVPNPPTLAEKNNYPVNQNLQTNAEKNFIFDQINEGSFLVSPEEIRFEFEERAAIFEYEGGFTRKEAEERAYRQTLKEFLSQQYPGTLAEFESIIYQSTIN